MEKAQDRLDVLARIKEYEALGLFDRDVENDPPTRPLEKGEVDYTAKKMTTKIGTAVANEIARRHFDKCIERGEFVIERIRGIENYFEIAKKGALITCNHFNAFDNYAVFKAIQPYLGKKRLYKIIREGNYTSFPGFYGYLFRHCNTLPIPSDHSVMREMLDAVDTLLKRGEKILIYPEQGMWWNYRKPRPLKVGAFRFAAKSMAPVLPMFITMKDTDVIGADGFPILAYTLHILPPIYPDRSATVRDNSRMMCEKNYEAWKAVYEDTYGIPLTYTTKGEVKPCSI